MAYPPSLRQRTLQPADRAAVNDLCAHGTAWEPLDDPRDLSTVWEIDGRLVAAAAALEELEVAPPIWVSEPVPRIATPFQPGAHRGALGHGLVLARGLDRDDELRIHRAARTLPGYEAGARWVAITAPVPDTPPFTVSEVAQQIAAGAIDWGPITVPLFDGYWPIGILTDRNELVLVRQNDEF